MSSMPLRPPRVFLSYAWESNEFRLWVKRLASRLRKDGVDARLDHWHLPKNGIIAEFMNREVRKAEWVLVLCSPGYQERTRVTEEGSRVAGVGWETRLLSSTVLVTNQNKVLAVLAQGEWQHAAPDWLLGQYYFDLSGPEKFERNYGDLLRAILSNEEQPPPLGVLRPEAARQPRKKPALGTLVPRLCDRQTQETQFMSFFWDNMRKQIPQVYLMHGDELESHDSFVQRLYETRVKQLAEKDVGPERATTDYFRVDWPEFGTYSARERDLRLALFRKVDERHERVSTDFSSAALCDLVRRQQLQLAMVHHPIPASSWDDITAKLLRSYLDFWSAAAKLPLRPQFAVVIDVLYPMQPRSVPGSLIHWVQRAMIKRRVESDFGAMESTPTCFVSSLNELRCVRGHHVLQWLKTHAILDSDKERYETVERLFRPSIWRSDRCRNMSDIEPELSRIHAEFTKPEGRVAL